jgi:cyanate lyase
MKKLDNFKAEILAESILKAYKEKSIEFCKSNMNTYADILNSAGLSPFDCTTTMKRILKSKNMDKEKVNNLLKINDQLILYTKVLNILKSKPTMG